MMENRRAAGREGADENSGTVPAPAPVPAPASLIRDNAGHILGQILNGSMPGIERAGECIGPYRLCEMIGEGGFGNVWRAEQEEPVRREVALKVIKRGMDTEQVLRRFNQERQALAALEHPNIATMLDAGVSPDGRPFFAMELVRGGTVKCWCTEQDVTLEKRLRLFIQVCQAVQHAHEKGLLHRDLKPANVLVAEVDGVPVPKIIDFGIAKVLTGSLTEPSLLTQTGQVIGTPLYMSPEQIEGGIELDPRSDVYALGALLYELLTGVAPFAPGTVGKGGEDGVKRAVLETPPERPSTRLRKQRKITAQGRNQARVAEGFASLPADLDWITMRALETRRDDRYASAADLAADVRRHLDSQPVLARGRGIGYRMQRWLSRRRRGLAPAAAGLATGILLLLTPGFFESEHWRNFRAAVRHAWVFDIGLKVAPSAAEASRAAPYENSLGMRFVPVPITGGPTNGQRVLFSIWATRVRDYEVFISETKREWIRPKFEQGAAHPVSLTSWNDAQAFCVWLTERERKAGKLGEDQAYRLPSDHEWSCAVGIGDREDPTQLPSEKRGGLPGIYPWGTQWPPPDRVGNYHSQETKMRWLTNQPVLLTKLPLNPFPDYRDGHALTAPVGSFAANSLGLYDMGGNVWEWCEDRFDLGSRRSIRGSSWFDYREEAMRSSMRGQLDPHIVHEHLGFRTVLAPVGRMDDSPLPKAAVKPSAEPAMPPPTLAAASPLERSFTNSLGMKFVPVPGTQVSFCIHETRDADYAAYAAAVPGTVRGGIPPVYRQLTGQERRHYPVVGISWEEAKSFCSWLSRKEGRVYRLPTDAEWSKAVGLEDESMPPGSTPASLDGVDTTHFPWEGAFPPKTQDLRENYADMAFHHLMPAKSSIAGYNDGFPGAAPVMRFKPNKFGLYDMGGNVNELCADWIDAEKTAFVVRGATFEIFRKQTLLSSNRGIALPNRRYNATGFRVVLEAGTVDTASPPDPQISR